MSQARGRQLWFFLFALGLACPLRATEPDWERVESEATAWLQEYLRIDTTNPPGNELEAARFWERKLSAEGIEVHVFETAPGRGGIWGRVRGRGGGGALLLLHHLDVVPANAEDWKRHPFRGEEVQGAIYGRGAVDAKGLGVAQAMAITLLRRHGIVPARDVLFVATPDEEAGGKLGAAWFVQHLLPQVGAVAFVLNEGGHIARTPSGQLAYEVAVAEKAPLWLRLTARGKAGHGSVPPAETAVTKLVQALAKLHAMPRGFRVTDEVQRYFAALAPFQLGRQQTYFADLRSALRDHEAFRQEFLLDPRQSALVHDTVTITVLQAGQKTNVIPATARAELDCRLLPGTDAAAFLQRIVETIDDPTIGVDTLLQFAPSSSPLDTPLYSALQRVAERERARVVPAVTTGFTDSHYFRARGIPSYGFAPFVLSEAERQGIHGVDEHLTRANVRDGIRRLFDLLRTVE